MIKFSNKLKTLKNEDRAFVDLMDYKTIWFNTGSRCNLSCENCYIESTPTNDQLSYLTAQDVKFHLEEIKNEAFATKLIGLTGGEPFINKEIIPIIKMVLEYGHEVLVLTNATKVIERHFEALSDLKNTFGQKLHLRVSLDHYTKELHEKERGENTFYQTLNNLKKLNNIGLTLSLAGRSISGEVSTFAYQKYIDLLNEYDIPLSQEKIVIFPEMDLNKDVPEISVGCWDILKKSPDMQMCASERMIVKKKGESHTSVLACTLIAYHDEFNLGQTLKDSQRRVYLNHKFCAQFCVLGGASCSAVK